MVVKMTTYTKEIVAKLITDYQSGRPVDQLAQDLQVPQRSVIAKLSSLGVYQRKQYKNKRGEAPRKKAEIIEKVAMLLEINLELCESLEKVNKGILERIEAKLDPQPQQAAAGEET